MRVFKRPGSPYWQYELSTANGKKRASAHTTKKKEAVALATYKQQQVNDVRLYDREPCISLGEACDRYLSEQQEKAAQTFKLACWNVKHILDGSVWSSKTDFKSVTTYQVEELKRLKSHLSRPSLNHLTTALTTMRNRAEVWGVQAPRFKVKKLRVTPKVRHLLPGEEQRLLEHTDSQDVKDLIITLVDTGLRLGEAVGLLWTDLIVQGNNKYLQIFRTKTCTQSLVPVTYRLAELLDRRQNLDTTGLYIFPGKQHGEHRRPTSKGIRSAAARAGLNAQQLVDRYGKFTAHSLRDTYATRLVKQGLSLYQVQVMLGHASPVMSQKYAHLATTDIGLAVKAALERSTDG